MTEQTDLDQAGCSAALTPDTLHIDLPHVDQMEVCYTIMKCLIQIKPKDWELMADGFVTCELLTELGSYCMDIIQTLSEAILDVVLPQVYKYMKTYGTFAPTAFCLPEDRIHAYLGDSIEQALSKCLKIQVQRFTASKLFCKLLLTHISKTVNSVLALSTQTPMLESRLPVVFVSGCVSSIRDLEDMVSQLALILTRALERPAQKMENAPTSQTASNEDIYSKGSPIFCHGYRRDLKKLLMTYIINMVKFLKCNAKLEHCAEHSNYRDMCIRVGTNAQILSEEDSEAHGKQSAMSSHSDWDALPGAVPESNNDKDSPFRSVTVISSLEYHSPVLGSSAMDSIASIADELADLQKAGETDGGGLEGVDDVKLRELTDRIFSVVMSGRDYQIPLVQAGTRMCDTVIYRKLRRGDVTNRGIIAHTLYVRTEEVVTRCAVQVLLWSAICPKSGFSSPYTPDQLSEPLDSMFIDSFEGGDHVRVVPLHNSPSLSQHSDITHDVISEVLLPSQSELVQGIVHLSMLSLLVGEMLTVIGIRSSQVICEVTRNTVQQLFGVFPMMYNNFHVSLMGQSYKDILQTVISDLLQEFGSLQAIQALVTSRDPRFGEAVERALTKQLTIPTSAVPHGKEGKEMTCSFFKKFKRWCCKNTAKKTGKNNIYLISGHDNDHLSEDEPLKDQTERHWCPFIWQLRKTFSSFARALGRPFVTCFCPESE
uniref:uncharacterized protein LOC124051034 n=1 Tax=Scatophagus argus TaxID=75038 RepID=UPI001ED7EB42|nr:uncharacterized protein LOC124051034 [Scatophagus argus]